MPNIHWKNLLHHAGFTLNCLLLFLAVFGETLQVPVLLQVAGRMHPLILHFPIVLMLLVIVWETVVGAKDNPLYRPVGDALLLATVLSTVVAALMGLFLSQEEGYAAATLFGHKWSGVAVSLLSWGWYVYRERIRQTKWAARAVAACGAVSILLAGHQGASITHGENYLWEPLVDKKLKANVLLEDALVFEDLVFPILKEKCLSCHNASKAKGELVLDSETSILKGGKTGKLWDSTAVSLGLLMERIHLPHEEKKHMPPKGKPQLSSQEIEILYHWIKNGANFRQKVATLPEKDTLRLLASELLKNVEDDNYAFPAAPESTVKKLNNDYRAVYPLALKSPALGVDFFGIAAFKSEGIKELEAVKTQIVSLNLNRMPVKDEDLKAIGQFTNLRKLNLSSTQITGAALGELKKLKALRKLSLSGTAVKPADLTALKELPELSVVYLWNTGVDEAAFPELQKQLPGIRLESGFKGDTIVAKLNAAIIESEDQVFTAFTKVKLKNFIKGAVVRYTLDGSIPDSLQSPVSNGDSITIDKTCLLTTKTFLPGWISSDVATRNFYKVGFTPDSVALVYPPNPQYKSEGPRTLVNHKIGDTDFRNKKWMGFKDNPLEAFLFFKQPTTLSSVSVSTVVDIGSYIMPAAQVEVWGGSTKNNLVLLKKINPAQPSGLGAPAYLAGFNLDFASRKVRMVKIIVKSVSKLPAWHPGKGTPGWVFVDEVFLN
ncbi:MAG: hypothetical protein HUU01_05315 [Saprospiraceae bacterium]|nr:hypothetical protein [Saprospiraceae bacterium]